MIGDDDHDHDDHDHDQVEDEDRGGGDADEEDENEGVDDEDDNDGGGVMTMMASLTATMVMTMMMIPCVVLCVSLEEALKAHLATKLHTTYMPARELTDLIDHVYHTDDEVTDKLLTHVLRVCRTDNVVTVTWPNVCHHLHAGARADRPHRPRVPHRRRADSQVTDACIRRVPRR
jgi:hypothetical protein